MYYATQIETRTEHFTGRKPMSLTAFQARIERADADVTTVEQPGYVEVLKDGLHVARYLVPQKVLWYETPEAQRDWLSADVDESWPPLCPACGQEMMVRHNRRTREPFFGCAQFPRCRGARPFTPHPDELAEYHAWEPPYADWLSPAANKARRQADLRWKWQVLCGKSLERLGYGWPTAKGADNA
jgi:hypothetical protein